MLRRVNVGLCGSEVRGAGDVTRHISSQRRRYSELYLDFFDEGYESGNVEETLKEATRLYTSTVPTAFQFRINDLPELYTNPHEAAKNSYRRIVGILTYGDFMKFEVQLAGTEEWHLRIDKVQYDRMSLAVSIGLPRGGAFMVETLDSCRCFITGRTHNDQIFTVDSPRSLRKYGFDPF